MIMEGRGNTPQEVGAKSKAGVQSLGELIFHVAFFYPDPLSLPPFLAPASKWRR